MTPLRLPKVASNRFMVFAGKLLRKELEIYSFATFVPRYKLHRVGSGLRLIGGVSKTHLV